MSDVIELARSARSRCRECRGDIEEGDLRFGSDHEGLHGDGSASYAWYHLRCATRRVPEKLLAAMARLKNPQELEGYAALVATCNTNIKKGQSRYPYGERAPSGRAKCIKCDQAIPKDTLRVAVEREIVTGTFATVGAGYLHPACAVAHLHDPAIGQTLRTNSPMLEGADLDEIAKLCDAVAASLPANGAAAPEPPPPPPRREDDRGEALVFADSLSERGDPRGELIVVEHDRAALDADDPRGAALEKRANKLLGAARKAWAKELGVGEKEVLLDKGVATGLALTLRAKRAATLPDSRWLTELRVEGGPEAGLAQLMDQPAFARIRALVVRRVPFTWEGFRGFCGSEAVGAIEALELHLPLGARAVLLLLSSKGFKRLASLTLSARYDLDPDPRGFERANGLPALRSLRLGSGVARELAQRLLRSPLAERLEELGTDVVPELPLPKLRRLALGRFFHTEAIRALASSTGLPGLESLDLSGSFLTDEAARLLADPRALPSVQRLDVSRTSVATATVDKLRARFGEGLVALDVTPSAPKKAPAKKKAAAKKPKKRK
jgi:hypothetical protein